ncbi:MAG: hypothetical protein IPL54_09785 [Chitinophagaceae bacterium]|nr:hypothetical protein [Chitinophagaceae bacterium]
MRWHLQTLTNIDMQHTINCDSAFTGIVYGLGYFESYAYNVGTLVNNLNAIGQIKNVNSPVGGVDTLPAGKRHSVYLSKWHIHSLPFTGNSAR